MRRSLRRVSVSGQLGLFPPAHQPALVNEAPLHYHLAVYRVTLVRETAVQVPSIQIHTALDAAALFRPYLAGVDREHFVVLLLNRKHHAIGLNTVSIGSLKASVVGVPEVFKPAILANADALICAHNHPSGDPAPSPQDQHITTRLVQAGKLLDIQVLDHLILGDGTTSYYSFADAGKLA